jgi:hypothetical protein
MVTDSHRNQCGSTTLGFWLIGLPKCIIFLYGGVGPLLRIHEILVRIQIRGSIPLSNIPYLDADPAIFVRDL